MRRAGQGAAVNLLIGSDPLDARVAQVIQAMAGEAGFDVRITVMEAATLLNRITNGNYEVSLLIWSGRADPDANISIWVACDGFVNYGKYCDRSSTTSCAARARSTDVAERKRLYAEAAAIYLPARPYLFLYHLKWFWGASAKLTGIVPHPDGIIRLQGLRLNCAGLPASTIGAASSRCRPLHAAAWITRLSRPIDQLASHQGASPMTIIDSQVHAYEANTPKRPWHSVPNWPDHVTGDEMVAAMDKVGVDGAIFISAFSMYQYDAQLCGGSAAGPSRPVRASSSRSTRTIRRWPMSSPTGRRRRARSASASC